MSASASLCVRPFSQALIAAEHVMVSTVAMLLMRASASPFLHALIAAEHVMVSTVQAGSDLRTRRAAMLLMSASASFASQATATQLGQKGIPAAMTSAVPCHVATLQPKLPQHMWWRRAGRGARRLHLIRWWHAGRR